MFNAPFSFGKISHKKEAVSPILECIFRTILDRRVLPPIVNYTWSLHIQIQHTVLTIINFCTLDMHTDSYLFILLKCLIIFPKVEPFCPRVKRNIIILKADLGVFLLADEKTKEKKLAERKNS